jgi:hypothetical protein
VKPRNILAMAVAIVLLVPFGSAIAHHPDHRDPHAGEGDNATAGHQHGGDHGHLPASSKNVELVGQLEPTDQFGGIVEGQIADLAVYKDYAYLNSWSEESCTKGGVYVVDIRNPKKPVEVDFIPALGGNYHGEGAHVISVNTKAFTGDLLAVNNEFCTETPSVGGGFDLYDVSDPANPKVLVQGAGDRGGEGQMNGGDAFANDYHSVFLWKDDGKVYVVGTDNIELHDVDIFDVTNPRQPKAVAEYDLLEEFPQIAETPPANGNQVFNHDMVVKELNGRDVLLDSYWDGGYVLVDVENPAKPAYIGDTDFGDTDPLGVPGNNPPEGNAHQAEFSHDNTYFLAADEDFNPYRVDKFYVGDPIAANERPAAEVGGGQSVATLTPDQTLDGKVVYGGYGCPADTTPLPQASAYPQLGLGDEEKILLMQRGPTGDPSAPYEACFPGEKAAKAFDAGWDAIVLVNRHLGSATADEPYCGSGAYDPDKPMVTICTTHTAYHELFDNLPAQYGTPYTADDAPAIGEVSSKSVKATSIFDGWGYAHLYRVGSGEAIEEVDAYSVPEAVDESKAFGVGDLSIHEFATDPAQNRAYISYYSAGVRVVEFGADGIEEVGHYIDDEGNNFWGIETFVPSSAKAKNLEGKRLFAGSDRDHGIFIFRYTGN